MIGLLQNGILNRPNRMMRWYIISSAFGVFSGFGFARPTLDHAVTLLPVFARITGDPERNCFRLCTDRPPLDMVSYIKSSGDWRVNMWPRTVIFMLVLLSNSNWFWLDNCQIYNGCSSSTVQFRLTLPRLHLFSRRPS